jgi:hypothetical protein
MAIVSLPVLVNLNGFAGVALKWTINWNGEACGAATLMMWRTAKGTHSLDRRRAGI